MVLTPPARRDERGAVAVVFALAVTVLVIMVALVVDLGFARDTRRVSQNAADSSALAGANALYPTGACQSGGTKPCVTDAVSQVKSYAQTNFNVSPADWTTCTGTPPTGYATASGTSCIAFDNASSPKKVWVRIPDRKVGTSFAGILGRQSIAVGSTAEAELGTDVKCTLCFLGSVEAENADFDVFGGAIAVNGNVNAGPNSYWSSASNGVVGSVSGGVFTPPSTTIGAFSDPLADLVLPLSDPALTVRTNPCTQGPGIYNTSISLGNNVTCTLTAGLYVVSSTWLIGNNTIVQGTGVTIYVPSPGYLNFKNGYTDIEAPTSGPFKDLGIVYARDNTNPLSIQGNGTTGVTGTVYAPASKLDFNGNSCFVFTGGPVVVSGVILANGNQSCIKILAAKDTTVSRTQLHLSQ
ncbi:Tad domain-containing protein [Phycicoccus duodecadis]|uniref:Putative Flp pilus-assembly TadE/G-like protein n=1 Tax=Phycicoccus duodecadis TaxID=173053 RepID=A0A2N3YJW5_9MICO|nr:Tad domain-containing protein [Phycicoccus duodecadis]PKW27161.1 putative Flp pilus-assembly TadE/G-like protein [Phycicoccus duodecadis]